MKLLKPFVRIVDDDQTVCESLGFFLRLAGWETKVYSSAVGFLKEDDLAHPGCVILDVRMPEMNGLELQQEMLKRRINLPIIFLTAHGDIDMAVQCIKAGAYNFLVKPPDPDRLQELVRDSIAKNIEEMKRNVDRSRMQDLFNGLTSAEQNVARLIGKGLGPSKIAELLSISERTVKAHRSNIFSKLDLENAVELSHFLQEL